MEYRFVSRKLKKEITFFLHGYVYIDLNGQEGTLGNQICTGGYLMGSTISCSEKEFIPTCRKWWKQYLKR